MMTTLISGRTEGHLAMVSVFAVTIVAADLARSRRAGLPRAKAVGRGQPAPPPPSHSRPLAETSPMWRQRHSPERHSPIRSTPAGSRRTPHCRPEVGGLHPRYIRQAA